MVRLPIPIPIGIAMLAFTSSYTGLLVHSGAADFEILLLTFVVIAIRMWHKGRIAVGALVAMASVLFCAFPALWLVLIGPAVVVVIQKTQ